MRKEEMTVYITNDNKRFFSEEDAINHEESLKNRKAYKVHYQPDLNETGQLMQVGYLIVEARWANRLWAEDWLYERFGNRVAFVQGTSPTWNWSIDSINYEEVDDKKVLAYLRK